MNKKILKLAIPNIISNITIPLLGLVDIAILGHLDSEDYLGAVSLGVMIFNMLYLSLGFLRMGTTGKIAQNFGARDFSALKTWFYRAVIVAIIISLLLLIVQTLVVELFMMLLNASADVEQLTKDYYYIRIYSAPATLINYVIVGWFIGMQNTRFAMWHTLFINVLNVGLNFLLVMGLSMNVRGVAYGSLIAQYMGLIFGMGLILRFYYPKLVKYTVDINFWQWKPFVYYFKINGDIFIRTVCLIATFSLFTGKSASINNMVLATNAILIQFLYFFSYFIDGFAYAAEALSGKYFGALDKDKFFEVIKRIFQWGITLSLAFVLLYFFVYNSLLNVLTNNKDLLIEASIYKYWVVLIPLVSFAAFIWDGIFVGITATKEMRNAMLMSVFIVFIPSYLYFGKIWGNHGLWLSMLMFMLARSISMSIFFRKFFVKI